MRRLYVLALLVGCTQSIPYDRCQGFTDMLCQANHCRVTLADGLRVSVSGPLYADDKLCYWGCAGIWAPPR